MNVLTTALAVASTILAATVVTSLSNAQTAMTLPSILSGLPVSDAFIKTCLTSSQNVSWTYENGVVCINGKIDSGTMYAFEQDMVPRQVDTIVLNSGGGTWSGGEMVSAYIAANQVRVVVPNDAKCFSNCVMLLAAGRDQVVESGSRVAVHYVYTMLSADHIVLMRELSVEYLSTIGNDTLLTAYDQFIVDSGLLSPLAWALTDRITVDKYITHDDKQVYWPVAAFMYMSHDDLTEYGIIK